MYERLHHHLVERVLLSLDDVLLARRRRYFGGGPAIALAHGEFIGPRPMNHVALFPTRRVGNSGNPSISTSSSPMPRGIAASAMTCVVPRASPV